MQWVDHATDVEARVAERRKTEPNFEEKVVPKANWRSEDFGWRVGADLTQDLPEEQWTYSVYDVRALEKPWGPQEPGKGKGPWICCASGRSFKEALLIAEVLARWKPLRMVWSAGLLLRQLKAQAEMVWKRESEL